MDNGESKTARYYRTYDLNVTPDDDGVSVYQYQINNIETIEGESERYIEQRKEWKDDGEMEYRCPIDICVSGNATKNGITQNVNLMESNLWTNRVHVKDDYTLSGGTDSNHYDPNFTEYSNSIISDDYTPFSSFLHDSSYTPNIGKEGNDISDAGKKWIYQLLSARAGQGLTDVTIHNLNEIAGIYETDKYYYAVTQSFDNGYGKTAQQDC